MPDATTTEAKTALRARLLAARAARDTAAVEVAGASLARHGVELCAGAGTVAAYVAMAGEPPTEPLLTRLRGAGVRVLLPVVDGDGLDWAVDTDRRRGAAFGIPEPDGPRLGRAAIAEAAIVLVPALAVDRRGVRLGRGRGYYDRALPLRSAGALTVALVYDDELVDTDLPEEAHDVRVDAALTPGGLRRSGPTQPS